MSKVHAKRGDECRVGLLWADSGDSTGPLTIVKCYST